MVRKYKNDKEWEEVGSIMMYFRTWEGSQPLSSPQPEEKIFFSLARTPTRGMDLSKTWYVSVTLLVIRAKFSEMVAAAIRAPLTRIWVESTFWMKCTFVLFASQALHWNVSQCQYVVNIMSSFTQRFRQMFNLLLRANVLTAYQMRMDGLML